MGIIYKAINKTNGKAYIGQTKCTLKKRWSEHIHAAKSSEMDCKFYRAICKYGEESFDVSVVESVPDCDLNEREMYWISVYDSYRNGYNSTLGGDGYATSDYDAIKRCWDDGLSIQEIASELGYCKSTVRAALKTYNGFSNKECVWRGKKNQARAVCQYDLDGNLIKTFKSTAAAAKELGIDRTLISVCCRKLRPTGAGYQWRYSTDDPPPVFANALAKAVCQYDTNGVFIRRYESIADAERITGANHVVISRCCLGKVYLAGGYQWRYADDKAPTVYIDSRKRRVVQITKSCEVVDVFESVSDAWRKTNIRIPNILRCCSGHGKTAGGYVWKYAS